MPDISFLLILFINLLILPFLFFFHTKQMTEDRRGKCNSDDLMSRGCFIPYIWAIKHDMWYATVSAIDGKLRDSQKVYIGNKKKKICFFLIIKSLTPTTFLLWTYAPWALPYPEQTGDTASTAPKYRICFEIYSFVQIYADH